MWPQFIGKQGGLIREGLLYTNIYTNCTNPFLGRFSEFGKPTRKISEMGKAMLVLGYTGCKPELYIHIIHEWA